MSGGLDCPDQRHSFSDPLFWTAAFGFRTFVLKSGFVTGCSVSVFESGLP